MPRGGLRRSTRRSSITGRPKPRPGPLAAGRPSRSTSSEPSISEGRAYYDTLDRLFRGYDAVLYELVAPDNARVPKPGRKPAGAIGSAQQGLTKMLGLEFQLEQIDYTARNFVHADLSPKEFDAAMAEARRIVVDDVLKLMREGVGTMRRRRLDDRPRGVGFRRPVFGILFFGSDREVRLRRIMAEQFTDMEVLTRPSAARRDRR
jgi:hypothetical protein